MMTFAEELADFLSVGRAPDELAAFRFSDAAGERLETLIREEKNGRATAEQREEIDSALALGHLVTLTKLKIARGDRSLAAAPTEAPARPLETAAV